MAEPIAVEFTAEVRKVTSTVGHTYSVTLNLPEYCTEQAQIIMGWLEDMVRVVMVAEDKPDNLTKLDDETEKRAEKRTSRVGRVRA